jgi:ribonuclease VapC
VAVILKEDGYEDIVFSMAEADARYISAGTYLESPVVLLKKPDSGVELELDRLIYESDIVIIPVTATHARIGRQAYLEYGKGQHPAKLNLGDCFAYALVKSLGEPLLFKGNDFGKTDIQVA